jgi:diguanylate cyclase (GGDEF)-like protein
MLPISRTGTRIGRSHENNVRFPDLSVSRRHATILSDAQGEVWLTDLNSSNGSFINGAPVLSQLPHRIRDGDRIRLGKSVVVKFVRLDPCDEQFQKELFERTVRDPLTKLYNRAFFLEQLDSLAALCSYRGLGLAVLMLDVDNFKRVNDTHGHAAGDAVLHEVAAVLREATRNDDLICRYGGEEFVLAVPVASPDQASERAERICSSLSMRRIELSESDAQGLHVTASVGLAFANADRLHSAADLVATADQCLYQAKNGGRNRVVIRVDPPRIHGLVTPQSGDPG